MDHRNTRIGGSKVRTGCLTCKQRRIKCDETHPTCIKCIKSGRQCDGYAVPITPSDQQKKRGSYVHYYVPPENSLEPLPGLKFAERRALAFVQSFVVPELLQPFSGVLWNQALQRGVCEEPLIRYAVISLGALHEAFHEPDELASTESLTELGLRNYGKAIGQMREMLNISSLQTARTSNLVLAACTLFATIENLQGHYQSSMNHVKGGMRILLELKKQTANNHGAEQLFEEGLIKAFFVTSGSQIISITDEEWDGVEWLDANDDYSSRQMRPVRPRIETLGMDLAILMKDIKRLGNIATQRWKDPDYPNAELLNRKQQLVRRFKKWQNAFSTFLSQDQGPKTPEAEAVNLLIKSLIQINYSTTNIFLNSVLDRTESVFDDFLEDFKKINHQAEAFIAASRRFGSRKYSSYRRKTLFNVGFGILLPLYLVCSRCRNFLVRRHALSLLKICQMREGMLDSYGLALLAEQLILIEERAAAQYKKSIATGRFDLETTPDKQLLADPDELPEFARISRLDTSSLTDGGLDVRFFDSEGREHEGRMLSWRN